MALLGEQASAAPLVPRNSWSTKAVTHPIPLPQAALASLACCSPELYCCSQPPSQLLSCCILLLQGTVFLNIVVLSGKRHNQCLKRSSLANFAVNLTVLYFLCGAVPTCVCFGFASKTGFAYERPCNRVCQPGFASYLSSFCLLAVAPPGSATVESTAGVFQEAHLSGVARPPLFRGQQALLSAALESKSMRNDARWGQLSFQSHDYSG